MQAWMNSSFLIFRMCEKQCYLTLKKEKVVIQFKFSILFYLGLPQPQREEWMGFGQRLPFPISPSSGFFQFSATAIPISQVKGERIEWIENHFVFLVLICSCPSSVTNDKTRVVCRMETFCYQIGNHLLSSAWDVITKHHRLDVRTSNSSHLRRV